VEKRIKVGPQDYDPVVPQKNGLRVVMKGGSSERATQGQTVSVKKQMEEYLGNIFEGDNNRDKHSKSVPPLNNDGATASIEQIQPFSLDKRDMTFKSKIPRNPQTHNK